MSHDPDKLSLIPSGYFGDTSDRIFTVQNFLSEDEIELLLSMVKDPNVWLISQYKNKYSDNNAIKKLYPKEHELLENIRNRWKKLISKFYDVEIETYNGNICKWPVGGLQRPHADKEWNDGSPGEQNYYDIGSVVYLNDDYTGGEIYFPQHGISLKPERGSATAFPGDLFFIHGVSEVKDTERYAIPIFWTVTKYEPEKDQSGNNW